ncbi:MAG: tRNA (guanosine(37)-N1)-methyltransferase TrmD [Rhodoferax sp.]
MRFDVITLFPELFAPFLSTGVTRRAFSEGMIDVVLHDLRDHASGTYRRVDDRPFGGGPGMVLMAEPLDRALRHAQSQRRLPGPVVLFSPAGRRLDQECVERWASSDGALLVCGRYEGLDQRWVDSAVDECISLGDFVLSGGELAALALLDAVARLQPGVLGHGQSADQDSFGAGLDGLLDCPHYTRPEVWRGQAVPPVLLSGHHAQIAAWRRQQRLALTQRLRPDLVARARAQGVLSVEDEAFLQSII